MTTKSRPEDVALTLTREEVGHLSIGFEEGVNLASRMAHDTHTTDPFWKEHHRILSALWVRIQAVINSGT